MYNFINTARCSVSITEFISFYTVISILCIGVLYSEPRNKFFLGIKADSVRPSLVPDPSSHVK